MRKFLAFVICFILLATPAMAFTNLTAPKATIALDGVKDDTYGGPYAINNYQDGMEGGATGQVWVSWDDDYINFYFDVKDDTPNHDHNNDYEGDCVELFFDWYVGQDDDTSDITKPYWQYRACSAPNPSKDDWQNFNGINQAAGEDGTGWQVEEHIASQDANTVVNLRADGYTIETRVEYKKFGINIKEGDVIAIDFMIGDNTGDGRASCAFLDPEHNTNEQWQWPYEVGGRLTLGPAAAAPVEPDEPDPIPEPDGNDDNNAAPPPPALTPPPAAPTGDSALMFIALIAALAGAAVITKRAKNKA